MKHFWIAAAAPFFVAAAPAMDAETREDVRCFTALMYLASSADSEQTTYVAVISQYYLGRIDARMPGLDLENAMAAEAASMSVEQRIDLAKSCSAKVGERGKELMVIGKQLQARGI